MASREICAFAIPTARRALVVAKLCFLEMPRKLHNTKRVILHARASEQAKERERESTPVRACICDPIQSSDCALWRYCHSLCMSKWKQLQGGPSLGYELLSAQQGVEVQLWALDLEGTRFVTRKRISE